MKNYLTDREIRMFEAYAENYSDRQENAPISAQDYLYKNWFENKKHIIKMFGGKTIIKKDIVIEMGPEMLRSKLISLITDYESLYAEFNNILNEQFTIADEDNPGDSVWANAWSWFDLYSLRENVFYECCYETKNFIFTSKTTGKKKKITTGKSKVMRALGWILQNADTSNETKATFDEFRIEHSKIMQTKTIKDTLYLSVHPLDFATMSDNVNNWDSCMSWQENGCYRAGTLEMLSSPYVIVGYLKSNKNNLTFSDPQTGEIYEWNSKTWRILYVLTDEFITAIKGYPYQNEELTDAGLQFLREWANGGYNPDIMAAELCTCRNSLKINDTIEITLKTENMYNDTLYADFNHFLLNQEVLDNNICDIFYNFSGDCSCLNCGQEITHHDTLVCNDCDTKHRCCECGEYIDSEDAYYDNRGNSYCYECWREVSIKCDWCGDDYLEEDCMNVRIRINGEIYYASMCGYCFNDLVKKEMLDDKGNVINFHNWLSLDIAYAFSLPHNRVIESGINWKE